MSDYHPSSFDTPRDRHAPTQFAGRVLDDEVRTYVLTRTTLIVAVKPHCDGCRAFTQGDLASLRGVEVLIVSAGASHDGEWDSAMHDVIVAPELIEALEIRGAPHYVVIDPTSSRVVSEGIPFSPTQVAHEIAPFLDL